MTVREVNHPRDWKLFHSLPHRIYKNDPNWICPLEKDIEQIFDPTQNKLFNDGDAKCFILLDHKEVVGRIAAFVDYKNSSYKKHLEGGIGFFECLNNSNYAQLLFQSAENYLLSKGVKVIDGPINFGTRDKFWGLLVEGNQAPLYQENYNPVYYQDFFLQEGYIPFEQILTLKGSSKEIPYKRLSAIAQRLRQRNPIRVEPLNYDNLDRYASDFSIIYNASFNSMDHFQPIEAKQIKSMMIAAKPIVDPNLVCIAYYDEQPAGFVALFPDINPYLKKASGKLNWKTLPGFLYRKTFNRQHIAKGIGFGIHPDFQSKGIYSLLIDFLYNERNLIRYPYMYLATIRAHNKSILSVYSKLQTKVERVHVAYRKKLADEVEINPFPFISINEPQMLQEV